MTYRGDTAKLAATSTSSQISRSPEMEKLLRRYRKKELSNRTYPTARTKKLDLAVRLTLFTAGYVGMISGNYFLSIPATIILAVTTVSMLGSWFHDAVHGNALLPASLVALVIRVGSSPVGFSPKWWKYKHVRMHHRYVGNPEFDPDIQFGYFARVVHSQKWHSAHRFQYLYIWIFLPFATLNMLKPSELWQRRRFSRFKEFSSAPGGWTFIADKYIPFLLFWAPLFATSPGPEALTLIVIFQLLAGTLVSLITQVQHNTSLSVEDSDYSMKWPLCEQLVRTTDVKSKSKGLWWWVCGGTNFHIVHHLAPTLSFFELPEATERLQEQLNCIGVILPAHKSLISAIRSHGELLYTLSKPE